MVFMLSMIYARSLNHCIGKSGQIPWHLPDEFAHFKQTTLGCPIIMGRKTYEDHESALPGRLNIVVTRQPNYSVVNGIVLASDLNQAIDLASSNHSKIFIIGGVEFFSKGYEVCDTVYETVVDADINGDAFLPAFDYSAWDTELMSTHDIDERHRFAFRIYRHSRRKA